jgi:Raf kinase inhibitor-like YbhB/YbcL family protein
MRMAMPADGFCRHPLAMRRALPRIDLRLRRWVTLLCGMLLVSGCSPGASAPANLVGPTPQSRPTPTGPTPALPVARAVVPSPSPVGSPNASGAPAVAAGLAFVLSSSAFGVGGTIPSQYTCDGADRSPPLAWTGAPVGTTAFALVEQDKDVTAANEPFTQWLLYNMPRTVTQLAEGVPAQPLLSNGSQQGQNSHSTIGYFGPCPDQGGPPHHYSIQLFAQDSYVTLETGASIDGVETALNGHILGQAQLQATLQR